MAGAGARSGGEPDAEAVEEGGVVERGEIEVGGAVGGDGGGRGGPEMRLEGGAAGMLGWAP